MGKLLAPDTSKVVPSAIVKISPKDDWLRVKVERLSVPAIKDRSPLTVLLPLSIAVPEDLLKERILNDPAEIVCAADPLKFTVPFPALKIPVPAVVQLPPTFSKPAFPLRIAPVLIVTDPAIVTVLLISNSPVVTTRLPAIEVALVSVAMVAAVFIMVRLL